MKAILLDRDETLNEDPGYLNDASRVVLKPGVVEGLTRLSDAGFRFYVLSNQSGVGRGLITPDQLKAVNERLSDLLSESSIVIDRFYICPHMDEDHCNCRKPLPGLVEQCLRDHPALKTDESFILGDRYRDLTPGIGAGMRGVLLLNGENADAGEPPANLIYSATDMKDAARFILENSGFRL